MMRRRKVLAPISAPRTRNRVPKQTKDIQRAIMDVILKEIESEKECRISSASGFLSEREASYGLMDTIIKRHKEANPWLNRDVLNNYKRIKIKEEDAAIKVPLVVTSEKNRDSVSTLTPVVVEHDENEPPLHPQQSHTRKKRG